MHQPLWIFGLALSLSCLSTGEGQPDSECAGLNCTRCQLDEETDGTVDFCCERCKNADCIYNGKPVPHHKLFKDTCRMCVCMDGVTRCAITCRRGHKPGYCPPPSLQSETYNSTCETTDNVCLSDYGCVGNLKCCNTGCRRECLESSGCIFHGSHHKEGSSFVRKFDLCRCKNKKVTCVKKRMRKLGIPIF